MTALCQDLHAGFFKIQFSSEPHISLPDKKEAVSTCQIPTRCKSSEKDLSSYRWEFIRGINWAEVRGCFLCNKRTRTHCDTQQLTVTLSFWKDQVSKNI